MPDLIAAEQLEVSAYPLRPSGGQHAGMPPMGVKIVHLPTGLTAMCCSNRSQYKNRIVALHMIESALTHPDFRNDR